MKKSALYTRTGDKGTTSLIGGTRIEKFDPRLQAYGTIDEFSSLLGIIAAHPECPQTQKNIITEIQSRLFDIGAILATPPYAETNLYGFTPDAIAQIEQIIDTLDANTPPMKSFILPGGSMIAAHCHVARTVCRRAEREILLLNANSPLPNILLEYINRLSDYLFILARHLNHILNIPDTPWNAPKPK